MSLWFKDLTIFFKEKRLTMKILVLLIILISLFVNALILISNNFTNSTETLNNNSIQFNYQKKLSSN
jgi:hypothetical protein